MRQSLVLRRRLECHWWPHLMRQSLVLRRRRLKWWPREQRTRQSCCWLRQRPERSSWSQSHRCRTWRGQCPRQSRRRCLRRRGRGYQILRLANMSLLSSLLHRACAQARARTKSLPVQTLLWWLPVQDETGCGLRGRGGGTEGSRTEGSSSEAPRCRGSGASSKSSTPER